MRSINFQNTYEYNIEYRPTRRSRKNRWQTMEETTEFEVQNLLSIEAPVAFKIHDCSDDYAQAIGRSLSDDWHVVYPVRYYKGNFYKEYLNQDIDKQTFSFVDGADAISKRMKSLSYPFMGVEETIHYRHPDIPYDPNVSIDITYVDGNPKLKRKNYIQNEINKKFIVIEDRLYVKTSGFGTGEPRYTIYTLGLGHNHGGTDLSIDFEYNGNLGKDRYFRADQFVKATNAALKIATDRGDTESAEHIKQIAKSKKSRYIEIIDSSAVQLHPTEEAGDGDPFLNGLESVISGSPDKLTAGLGVLAKPVDHLNKD